MIPWFRLVGAAGVLAAIASSAFADTLGPLKRGRWLVVASTKDVDSAIGIAAHYTDAQPRVVESSNGWYAVVMGPYRERSIADLARRHAELPMLPSDALMSRGKRYVATVWHHDQDQTPQLLDQAFGQPLRLKSGNLKIKVTMNKPGARGTAGTSVVSATVAGKEVFRFEFGDSGDVPEFMRAGVVLLDHESEYPQVVLTRYSGGAHCCTRTWIATKPKSAPGWILMDAGELDGEGYGFYDLDGDGAFELGNIDNDFLYAFDSYANSYAPIRYRRLTGGRFSDVSGDAVANHALKQDIAALEFHARLDPENWRRNGYLAAWVASKVRLGQGEDAWTTMLENFDRDSEVKQQECLTGEEIDKCPAAQLRDIPFPEALARFLQITGYGPLPQSVTTGTN